MDYSIGYGWEFVDAKGQPVDSSFFANGVTVEGQELNLLKLSAPDKGNFPMRIRCVTVVDRRQQEPEEERKPPRKYESEYAALYIKREDGTVTEPDPSKETPDCEFQHALLLRSKAVAKDQQETPIVQVLV